MTQCYKSARCHFLPSAESWVGASFSVSVCPLPVCVSCDRRLVPLEILMDRCSCVCLPRCFHLALLQRHRGFGCAGEVRSPGNLAGRFPRFAFVRPASPGSRERGPGGCSQQRASGPRTSLPGGPVGDPVGAPEGRDEGP